MFIYVSVVYFYTNNAEISAIIDLIEGIFTKIGSVSYIVKVQSTWGDHPTKGIPTSITRNHQNIILQGITQYDHYKKLHVSLYVGEGGVEAETSSQSQPVIMGKGCYQIICCKEKWMIREFLIIGIPPVRLTLSKCSSDYQLSTWYWMEQSNIT